MESVQRVVGAENPPAEGGAWAGEGTGEEAGARDPPVREGGWGWLVVVAIAINKMATWGSLPVVAIVYRDVFTQWKNMEGSAITLIVGIFFLCTDIGGIFFPLIHRIFSARTTSITGGILVITGGVISIFVVSVPQLAISYGILQGVGNGLIVCSTVTVFNRYFRRRRTTAMAGALLGTSVLMLGVPLAVQAAMDADSARGGRLVLLGMNLAVGVAQLFVRSPPAAQHPPHDAAQRQTPLLTAEGHENCNSVERKKKLYVHSKNATNEECEHQPQATAHARVTPVRQLRSCARRMWRVLGIDEQLFDDPRVWGAALGIAVVHVCDSNFFGLLPMHLTEAGLDKESITQAVTVANAGDAVGRMVLVAGGRWLSRSNRLLLACGAFGSAVSLFGIAWLTSWTVVATLSFFLGFGRGLIYVTFFLGMAELVAPALFPAAVALQFFFVLISTFLLAPLIGLVRDATSSYPASFCFVSVIMALYPLAWGLSAASLHCSRRSNAKKLKCSVVETFSETGVQEEQETSKD